MRGFSWASGLFAAALCSGIATSQALGQEPLGTTTSDDISAHELYAARFSVDGKRRLEVSSFYTTNSELNFAASASRHFGGAITYAHPVTERFELSLGAGASFTTTETAFDGLVVNSRRAFSDPSFTLGSRFGLTPETSWLPQMTLFGNLTITDDLQEWIAGGGLSFVTTSYPAFLFGSVGAQMSERGFAGVTYTTGASLAINDKLSIGGELSGFFSTDARPGFLGETMLLGSRIIYAVNRQWSLDAGVSVGLTQESPDMTLSLTIGYRF